MNIIAILLQAKPDVQIPESLSWGIIVLLSGIIVWALIRYMNKLDAVLERLEDSIESINKSLIQHTARLDNHEAGIKDLKEIAKIKPRR